VVTPVLALTRMRLTGFVRTGRAVAPLITVLVVLGILYGGGQAQAGEAYGVSAAVLFPVLAWQSKLLLDVEPDVQRRLALVTIGGRRRELVAGLLAAAVTGLVTAAIALAVPWLVGGIRGPRSAGEPSIVAGIALGAWAHLLVVPAAVALGALSSRATTRSTSYGVAILAAGAVGSLVLGLKHSIAPWLVPPVMATARALTAGPSAITVTALTGHALLWSAVALTGYGWLRHRR
jgi:hypothetical protein